MTEEISVLGTEEFGKEKRSGTIRACMAEFVGTAFFVAFGCGAAAAPQATVVRSAFAFGLTAAVIIRLLFYVSGGHINPAITVGLCIGARCSVLRALMYVVAQLLGGISGAAVLYSLSPQNSTLGVTDVSVGVVQGIGIEIVTTFVLVSTVYAVTDSKHSDSGAAASFYIGFAISVGVLFGAEATGPSMNPARSFGPALIMFSWHSHFVYWVGPILGGVLAGLFYKFVLHEFDWTSLRSGTYRQTS